jgi:hypothetical protein
MSRAQKTLISKKSKNKNAMKNSFRLWVTLFQLAKIHIGINKVVNNKKNKEIPSTPTKKFKLSNGDTKNLLVN